MHLYRVKNEIVHFVAALISVCFVFSFGMHAIQVTHGHTHFDIQSTHLPQEGVSDYSMHHTDSKYVMVFVETAARIFFVILVHSALTRFHAQVTARVYNNRFFLERIGREVFFISVLLRMGILNTKCF